MSSDNSNSMGFLDILGIFTFALTLGVLATLVYLFVYTKHSVSSINGTILEIKSKIGSMIRDINHVNHQEFSVETQQQQSINDIVSRIGP